MRSRIALAGEVTALGNCPPPTKIGSRRGAAVQRDRAVAVLFGFSLLVTSTYLVAGLFVSSEVAFARLLQVAALLTGMLSVAGVVCGALRGVRTAAKGPPRAGIPRGHGIVPGE